MFTNEPKPYGMERHQQLIADAERQRRIDALPNHHKPLPVWVFQTVVVALANLMSR